jgi:hypothetical protein
MKRYPGKYFEFCRNCHQFTYHYFAVHRFLHVKANCLYGLAFQLDVSSGQSVTPVRDKETPPKWAPIRWTARERLWEGSADRRAGQSVTPVRQNKTRPKWTPMRWTAREEILRGQRGYIFTSVRRRAFIFVCWFRHLTFAHRCVVTART